MGRGGEGELFCRTFGVITGNPVAGTPRGMEEHRSRPCLPLLPAPHSSINSCLKFSSKSKRNECLHTREWRPPLRDQILSRRRFRKKKSLERTKLINFKEREGEKVVAAWLLAVLTRR